MKIFFAIALVIFIYPQAFISLPPKKISLSTQQPLKADTVGNPIDFKVQIQPIFVKRCSPCHFEGGKMYERMPFDSAQTIINNSKGILRRIKDSTENALISDFVKNRAPE
jgi:hypothetical protein